MDSITEKKIKEKKILWRKEKDEAEEKAEDAIRVFKSMEEEKYLVSIIVYTVGLFNLLCLYMHIRGDYYKDETIEVPWWRCATVLRMADMYFRNIEGILKEY